jgi:hypothetical protein
MNSEYNKRIKAARFVHSTAQSLRARAALYARRWTDLLQHFLQEPGG